MRLQLPLGTRLGERWRFRSRRPTNHPRTSYQTRVWGSPSQRWFYVDGLFSSASDAVVVGFLSVYAIALGATNAEIGLLAIANGLAGFLALSPGAWLAERVTSRKLVVLIAGGGVARLTILLMALAPILVREPTHAVYALIALTFVRWFAGSAGHPSWVSLLADIIPLDLRRFYVSQRMLGITIVSAIMAPLAGTFIGRVNDLEGFQWAFIGAFLFGVVSTVCYSRIAEPARPARHERPPGSTRAMLGDRLFMRYMAGTFVLHMTTMIAGPFFVAYLVRDLGATPAQVGLLTSIDHVAAVAAQLVLGLVITRYPTERMVRLVMLVLPVIPIIWLLPREPMQAVIPYAVGGAAWAIYNVVSFNLLMEYAPPSNIPRYAATQQMTVLAASFLGPVIGTAIVAQWGIRTAILVSGIGRLVAAGVMVVPVRTPAVVEEVIEAVDAALPSAEPSVAETPPGGAG